MNRSIPILLLFLILHGHSNGQWQKTTLPVDTKVSSLAIRDSIIFAGSEGEGIFRSTDDGESWTAVSAGLQGAIVHAIFIDGSTVFAGTETGASLSTNDGSTWDTIHAGLPDGGVWSFASRNIESDDSTIFAGTWSGVYASADNGKSWEATGLPQTSMPVHSLNVRGYSVFAATLAGGVFYSSDNGTSWQDISILHSDEHTGDVALIPVYSLGLLDSTVVAGAGPGYFYYTSLADHGFGSDRSVAKGNRPFLCLAFHDARLFAGNTGGNIYRSNSDGSTWTFVSSLPAGHCVYSLALSDSSIFAGTESGVWRLRYAETGVRGDEYAEAPAGFVLEQNYPNPFNPKTVIRYRSPAAGFVKLSIYNLLGQKVKMLVDSFQYAGGHSIAWDGTDDSNTPASSGIYFYRLETNTTKLQKKMILIR
jgi:hypothetical protein